MDKERGKKQYELQMKTHAVKEILTMTDDWLKTHPKEVAEEGQRGRVKEQKTVFQDIRKMQRKSLRQYNQEV